MSKKKMKTVKLDLGGKKLIEFHTANMNKHGELKGRNKKETKVLKDTCMHHKIGKKGRIKSRTDINNGEAHCTMCGHDFPMVPYSKDERKRIIDESMQFLDHTKFLAAAIGADENTQRALAETCVNVRNASRINKHCTKIVEKDDKLREKNKKNKNTTSTMGSWNVRR